MDPYRVANRALWDEWTDIHARSTFYDLEGFKKGDVRLEPFEIEEIGDVSGKSLLHLQCHFGIDTLSWARLGARVTGVRPGGFLYVHEQQPTVLVWDDADDVKELRLRYPYFERPHPLSFPVRGSYADRDAEVTQPVEYAWCHSLGEIVTAVAEAELRIDFLHEFPFLFYPVLPFLEQRDGAWWLPAGWPGELPLSFSLKATKPDR